MEAELDQNYLSQWDATLERSLQGQEPDDVKQIRAAADSWNIRELLSDLQRTNGSQGVKHSVSVILISLDHIESFHRFLVDCFGPRLDVSAVWGMLHLVIKLAAEPQRPAESAESISRIAEIVKKLSQKIELFNEYSKSDSGLAQMRVAALDVHMDLVNFFAASIRFFRGDIAFEGWNPLMKAYESTLLSIDETYQRIDRLTRLGKRRRQVDDFPGQQALLSLSRENSQDAQLPCIMLPPAKNARVYDRDSITDRIESYLYPSGEAQFRALVLYGMGGVGKSHIALKYALLKTARHELDAVLWLNSDTEAGLAQSFTDAALALALPRAGRERPEENRILVLNWLQQTNSAWLLVYDNAEDPDVLLRYWPLACTSGAILVTSRNHNLRFGPADYGIEVPPFDVDSGSKLLLHLLRMDVVQDLSRNEVESALKLSNQLDGHALAISFMAGLIQKRSWTIQEYLEIYERNKGDLHGERRPNTLSTIWYLSFRSLEPSSASLLGILSYINPDSIAEEILITAPAESAGFANELDFYDALEPLLTLALLKRNKESKTLSIHRLVQTQYRYYLKQDEHQKAFDQAVKLLFDGFGRVGPQLYDRWAHCQMYIQQILSLKDNYKKEATDAGAIKPTLRFCWLLSDSSRFLIETAGYMELEDTMSVAASAWKRLTQLEKDEGTNVYTSILGATGLLWGHRGYFSRAIPFVRECHKIQNERPDRDWNSLSWSQVNLGNVLASIGAFEEALEWQLEAAKSRAQLGGDDAIKPNGIVQQNIGRCYMLLGRFDKAREHLQAAMREFEGSQNWAMLAYTLFVLGSLERRQGNGEAAREAYTKAHETWISGGSLKTHHFNGACLYKLGCVAGEAGDAEKALEYLRAALVITKLKEEVMPGDHARVLHKLGGILRRQPNGEVAAAEAAAEALQIRMKRSLSITSDSSTEGSWSVVTGTSTETERVLGAGDPDEELYDGLVYILWR